ncbi:hypothetical protein [Ensifer soli]|uniref:hypothetical protein n=1 Tax=Ciceribacter sp. sgz301302 TaxID=3342379 RepID=UPI0035B91CFD
MFVVVDTLTCWWPVKVLEPHPTRVGVVVEHEFEVEFEILDREENKVLQDMRAAILKEAAEIGGDDAIAQAERKLEEHDEEAFRRVLRNWRKIVDQNKAEIPFTLENLSRVLTRDHVRAAINRAYQDAISQDKARRKN